MDNFSMNSCDSFFVNTRGHLTMSISCRRMCTFLKTRDKLSIKSDTVRIPADFVVGTQVHRSTTLNFVLPGN